MKAIFNITKVQVADDRTSLEHYNELNYSRVVVDNYKSFQSIVIVGTNELVEIPYENIPVLIAMLQSVNSKIK